MLAVMWFIHVELIFNGIKQIYSLFVFIHCLNFNIATRSTLRYISIGWWMSYSWFFFYFVYKTSFGYWGVCMAFITYNINYITRIVSLVWACLVGYGRGRWIRQLFQQAMDLQGSAGADPLEQFGRSSPSLPPCWARKRGRTLDDYIRGWGASWFWWETAKSAGTRLTFLISLARHCGLLPL